jgi:hypothetical protein
MGMAGYGLVMSEKNAEPEYERGGESEEDEEGKRDDGAEAVVGSELQPRPQHHKPRALKI